MLPVLSVEDVESFFLHHSSPDSDQSLTTTPWIFETQVIEQQHIRHTQTPAPEQIRSRTDSSSAQTCGSPQAGRNKAASWPRAASKTHALLGPHTHKRQRRWKTAARAMIPFSFIQDP
ncbi:unnamed protein product [Echinostoma caproni]|uniref:Uncharacterized protein n=1 Tax=Echinostoma caproni TaxID=27848 RepID=A0A183AIE3_9TREM|nr:unnamed protein product [Echinostoma caproni]